MENIAENKRDKFMNIFMYIYTQNYSIFKENIFHKLKALLKETCFESFKKHVGSFKSIVNKIKADNIKGIFSNV